MWKHKTKWLVRGGRKVRCHLCGKKILAKGDLFLFHGDTGYYSHQSCQAESTTISGNERRRAVKKIAVGAAVVGAIAAGAGKLIDISSQSKGSSSPDTQTILTSQGLIPPALTSDPANPVPGQMWYRSDAGVMAHFDGVQNRVVYSSEINDGNVHVTSKGIVNGLSVLPNDGTGWFGPDTTLNATAPGQYGSPYTKTSGIQEAHNALPNVEPVEGGQIQLGVGIFHISETINITTNGVILNGVGLDTFAGSTIFLDDNANVSMLNVTGNKCLFKNFNMDGNSSNQTTSGLYGMYSTTGNFGQDFHIGMVYVTEVNGIGIYSNAGTYINRTITEGNASWGLYLEGPADTDWGWEVDDYLSYADGGGLYLNSDGMEVHNVHIHSTNTLSSVEIAGNNNNISGLSIESTYEEASPPSPLVISGTENNINDIIMNVTFTSAVTTIPAIISFTGGHNQIGQIYNVNSYASAFISLTSSGFNQFNGIYGAFTSNTYVISDTGFGGNVFNDLLLMATSSLSVISQSTTITSDILHNVHAFDNSSGAPLSLLVPTTPSVPTSATAQENTNPYAVDVYMYGGTVTEIQITKSGTAYTVFSNSTGVALSGQAYKLNPSDSITVTYTTAPTWEWLSD
jgi:hypothetical protein